METREQKLEKVLQRMLVGTADYGLYSCYQLRGPFLMCNLCDLLLEHRDGSMLMDGETYRKHREGCPMADLEALLGGRYARELALAAWYGR